VFWVNEENGGAGGNTVRAVLVCFAVWLRWWVLGRESWDAFDSFCGFIRWVGCSHRAPPIAPTPCCGDTAIPVDVILRVRPRPLHRPCLGAVYFAANSISTATPAPTSNRVQYAMVHAGELIATSIAIESDEGPFQPYELSFTGNATALAQLTLLSALLAPIGAGNVSTGGSGADIGPMGPYGVPLAAMEVLDPRIGAFGNNPCLGFAPLVAGTTPASTPQTNTISDGYFW
jgi:hypothetical protein